MECSVKIERGVKHATIYIGRKMHSTFCEEDLERLFERNKVKGDYVDEGCEWMDECLKMEFDIYDEMTRKNWQDFATQLGYTYDEYLKGCSAEERAERIKAEEERVARVRAEELESARRNKIHPVYDKFMQWWKKTYDSHEWKTFRHQYGRFSFDLRNKIEERIWKSGESWLTYTDKRLENLFVRIYDVEVKRLIKAHSTDAK